jgi:pyruvate formate-lyase activating enzyme-like uncharacterized protein
MAKKEVDSMASLVANLGFEKPAFLVSLENFFEVVSWAIEMTHFVEANINKMPHTELNCG